MNILPAKEIKRRGVKAIELALRNGPVHIIKNNAPSCVVLSEAEYARLTAHDIKGMESKNTLQWLLSKKCTGSKDRADLDKMLRQERESWKE